METKLLLNEFINVQHYFSLDQLNERLRCFPFSQEELRDKPTAINQNAMTGGSLNQSGKHLKHRSLDGEASECGKLSLY